MVRGVRGWWLGEATSDSRSVSNMSRYTRSNFFSGGDSMHIWHGPPQFSTSFSKNYKRLSNEQSVHPHCFCQSRWLHSRSPPSMASRPPLTTIVKHSRQVWNHHSDTPPTSRPAVRPGPRFTKNLMTNVGESWENLRILCRSPNCQSVSQSTCISIAHPSGHARRPLTMRRGEKTSKRLKN